MLGCGKATKIEAHKTASQFQGKTTTPEKFNVKEQEVSQKDESNDTKKESAKALAVEPIIDTTIRENIEKALGKIEVKSFLLSKMLTKPMWEKAQKYSFELLKCDISYLGPICKPNTTVTNHASMSLFRYTGQYFFYVEFKPSEKDPAFAFLFHFEKIEPEIVVKKIDAYSLARPRQPTIEIPDYLKDTSSTLIWTELGLSKTTFDR